MLLRYTADTANRAWLMDTFHVPWVASHWILEGGIALVPSGSILTGGAVVPRGTVISMCPAEVACWSTFVHLDVEWTRSQMGVGVKGLGLVAVVLLAPFPVVAVVVTAVVVIVVVAIGVVVVVVGLECGLLVHVMCLLLVEHNLLLELRVGVGEVGNGGLGGLMASCELGE